MFDHFWQPFGALDPFWEGSGSQRETEWILDTIFTRLLVDLGNPWVPLWIPFDRKKVKKYIQGTFFWDSGRALQKTPKFVWFLTSSNLLDWALVWARAPFSLSTHNPKSLQKRNQKWLQNTHFGHLWHPKAQKSHSWTPFFHHCFLSEILKRHFSQKWHQNGRGAYL